MARTRVAPLKLQTIPRLELCGALLLARLLHHVKDVLGVSMDSVHAWCDSTTVLDWLASTPTQLKQFVGNRVASIIDLIPCDRWRHIKGEENPADCASRGLMPADLVSHPLWWSGPPWLAQSTSSWPRSLEGQEDDSAPCIEVLLAVTSSNLIPVIPVDRYSSFIKLKRVTGWIMRFISRCREKARQSVPSLPQSQSLTPHELEVAENYWLRMSQAETFGSQISMLKDSKPVIKGLLAHCDPYLDTHGLLRIGGRLQNAQLPYQHIHPIILNGEHSITKMIIRSEHERLLHAGPMLLHSTLNLKFHIFHGKKSIRSITRTCITCKRLTTRPLEPSVGSLPTQRVTPGHVFDEVGVDYAGPVFVKYGFVRKPTIVKTYIAVFVSLTVKAVHLELVSELTSEAFIACLRCFISRRGKPRTMWSDHGTNFVGANKEIKEMVTFLKEEQMKGRISRFCCNEGIDWKFIPERAPHFGGLWEAAVKSMKLHLRRVIGEQKCTFEEYTTLLVKPA